MTLLIYRETALLMLHLSIGADVGPEVVIFLAVRTVAMPYVYLAHVDPGRVVRNRAPFVVSPVDLLMTKYALV